MRGFARGKKIQKEDLLQANAIARVMLMDHGQFSFFFASASSKMLYFRGAPFIRR